MDVDHTCPECSFPLHYHPKLERSADDGYNWLAAPLRRCLKVCRLESEYKRLLADNYFVHDRSSASQFIMVQRWSRKTQTLSKLDLLSYSSHPYRLSCVIYLIIYTEISHTAFGN